MKSHTTTLTLAACLALTLGGLFSLHGQDATPRQRGAGRGFGGPGFDSLSQDEKDKLKAAFEKAQQDSKVKEAREKIEADGTVKPTGGTLSRFVPRERAIDPLAESGRGLNLVRAFAQGLAIEPGPRGGTRVRVTFTAPAPLPAPRA